MNQPSRVRIIFEKMERGKVVDRKTFSLYDPPYQAKHFWLRYAGKRSKKYETITITALKNKLGSWLQDWLK